MKFLFEDRDLTIAITALRVLLFEYQSHNNEDRAKLVWEPTREFFEEMADRKPRQITCFSGQRFQFPAEPGCICQRLYAINSHGQVAYIGTVFNHEAIVHYRDRLRDTGLGELSAKRITRGRFHHCVIPAQTEDINEDGLIGAVKTFFTSFLKKTSIPSLADARIKLLEAEEGKTIEEEILRLAQQTSQPATRRKRMRKFLDDMT
ncbi:MAG TPA: hypothetical protein VI937_02525 [Negativicutes bacterium]|nr:MAG: hypothetical protein A3C50_01880 [Candidatus Staskawiczbacteria bacterium RIFCSPHIGHO2_02_FULL_43_16]OGZ74448.1 MAG: hypothetical protein A3A12_01610 [Candidatus Staskawiczbacteria bacterium RIFCSPLOWO2_01_FULL_43_17b]HLD70732.1 hypothetical protein [Negativicutes bacterium]